ncbi:MAG: hypothetical protein KKC39_07350 [Candidatus Omnitrophica bacterium]|nr:hypothetical protein [Candidatus Omnitrophota bacterium]MBU4468534.1 hypothetical protein [Candidatus Omnitrophota bacterium]MCG2707996.1 hypothetical protein [Candidatus Omnitrophota bacterium]
MATAADSCHGYLEIAYIANEAKKTGQYIFKKYIQIFYFIDFIYIYGNNYNLFIHIETMAQDSNFSG